MNGFVDIYALPLPTRNLNKYKRFIRHWSDVLREYGAVRAGGFRAEDSQAKAAASLVKAVKLKDEETLVIVIVGFHSKAHRERVHRKAGKDPRMAELERRTGLFDRRRMAYTGLELIWGFPTD